MIQKDDGALVIIAWEIKECTILLYSILIRNEIFDFDVEECLNISSEIISNILFKDIGTFKLYILQSHDKFNLKKHNYMKTVVYCKEINRCYDIQEYTKYVIGKKI